MMDDLLLRVPFVHSLGPVLEERRAGYARMSLKASKQHAGRDNTLHGGVLTTLMDSATAIALRELRGAGATLHSSIEMNTTYLAPVPPGQEIVIEGRVLQMEPVVAFAEASATLRESGELVATARVTFAIQQERS
jgi:uncharacterized protein (TIGR00369 family)